MGQRRQGHLNTRLVHQRDPTVLIFIIYIKGHLCTGSEQTYFQKEKLSLLFIEILLDFVKRCQFECEGIREGVREPEKESEREKKMREREERKIKKKERKAG